MKKEKQKCTNCGCKKFYRNCISLNYYEFENGELENTDNEFIGESDVDTYYYCNVCETKFDFIDEIFQEVEKELKTIVICKNEHAVFCGSEELQTLLNGSIESDYGTTKTQGYIEYSLEDLKGIVDIYENPYREELDLLIKEMEENSLEHLRIEY